MHFAKDNGIEIDQLNTHMKVSGNDIVSAQGKKIKEKSTEIKSLN